MASDQEIASLPRLPATSKSWADSLNEEKNNNLGMETTEEGNKSIWGSIIYHQDIGDTENGMIL